MNANVAIQVLPSVLEDDEIVRIVDAVIDYIKGTGVEYYVGPCETAMEGDYKPDGENLTIEKKTAKHHLDDAAKKLAKSA